MREKLRALYYPDFWVEYPTLVRSILLFDEIHFMDRPSFTFDGQTLTVGATSPIRQHEKWFRDQGVPLYVHQPPSGPVTGELLKAVENDISDSSFLSGFQRGLRDSPHFRSIHIQPGNYGNNVTHDTVLEKLSAIDLQQCQAPVELLKSGKIRPFDFSTFEGTAKTLINSAAFCSAKMNFALEVGAAESFAPFADASPYANLLSSKYRRAISASSAHGMQIPVTDLTLAIFDELVPVDILNKITLDDAITFRKETDAERSAFLEHVLAPRAKVGTISVGEDYKAAVDKFVTSEIRPAARDYSNKLDKIYEKLLGKIAQGTVGWLGSSAVVQVFGDLNWQKLLALAMAAAAFVAKEAIDAHVESRAVARDSAFSFLLDLEPKL